MILSDIIFLEFLKISWHICLRRDISLWVIVIAGSQIFIEDSSHIDFQQKMWLKVS